MSEPLLKRDELEEIVKLAIKSRLLERGPNSWRRALSEDMVASLEISTTYRPKDLFRSDLDHCVIFGACRSEDHPLLLVLEDAAKTLAPRAVAEEFDSWAKLARGRLERQRRAIRDEIRARERRRTERQRAAYRHRAETERRSSNSLDEALGATGSQWSRSKANRPNPRETDPHLPSDLSGDGVQLLLAFVLLVISLAALAWWWAMA